ncbi:uncharacterized protein H6S33_009999 [Morchella sextelata]|uniref:uncharacterized protein n=1 Tax=Morchella sextelata TaxID=1174677 RepID=UPI001D051E39|nr:uncharacterized protein H6S33_009999 [Morchella sextelata]KAH0611947.1 hypothetical protein H6S33_009999 [Morchella sextelata]
MASSIFAPLFPDEASHKKRYQISLDDNNPDITRTLFELCHFERIVPMHPPSLEGASLFAASSRRYGLVNLMAPWVMTWTSSLYDNDKLDFSKGDDLIAWLNICLIFRQEEMFRKITRRAIITATAESLNLAVPIESPFKEIIESIARRRITVITELITVALALLARYQTAEGPMSFGLYQPVPISPYPGMSAMGIIGEIKDLQLRTDPSHSGTCGREIKIEIIEKLRIAIGILELVKGLSISKYNLQTEQAEEFLLQVVEDPAVQTYDKEHPKNGGGGKAENKESRGGRNEEPTQGPRKEVDEERNEDVKFSDKDGDYEKDESSSELSTHINQDLDSLSETSDIQVPAGVIDGFSETKETIEDFGPQVFFREGDADARRKNYDIEKDEEEQKQEGEDLKDNVSLKEDKDATTLVYMQEVIPDHSNITMNNEPAPADETYSSLATNGIENALNPEIGEKTLPKVAPLRHAVARANAEAHGQTWSTPGSELARKYQRGPRNPFPDGITVGDVSHEGHIADLKVLKSRFPALNVNDLITFLKQKNWDLQLATEFLSATEIAVTDQSDTDTHNGTVSVINTLALEPKSDYIIYKEPGEYLEAPEKTPTEASATEGVPQLAIQESAPISYEESHQNSITSPEAPLGNSDIHQVPSPATLGPVLDTPSSIPRKAPLNDSTIQEVVLQSATPESVFEKSTFISQEKAPEGSITTKDLLPPPTVSVSDGSSSTLQKAMSECSVTKEALSPNTILNKVSISRLIAGKLSKEEAEKRFWPTEEDMDIKKYLGISANRKIVKKLVHRFPESTPDRGLIDVLYRSGWDLEKATSMLEGLGLVRRAI